MNLIKYKTFIIETIIKYRENLILGFKKLKNNFYLFIIKYFTENYKTLNKTLETNNPLKLQDFAPVFLSEKDDDKYADFIKYAIDKPNTKNVALTGPYGSGKSTILNTFEKNNLEYKYLKISLATFDEKSPKLNEIEYCILKQLFYKVEQKKIPQSRFKRIVNQKNVGLKSIFFFGWLISAIYFQEVTFKNGIKNIFVFNFGIKYIDWNVVLFTIGLFVLTYKVMDFVFNFKLSKFKFGEAEIESNNDKKSVDFENEIDEILYFFERNPYTVVFLEDLDRHKNTEIFIKLREINFLLNNYEPIKEKRKITFIYAVQDDTFKEDERAKFFDFIIPVIPFINYTNSSKALKEKINWKEDEIDENFIKKVSRYLSDNRTIISIANEYKIYKKTLAKGLNSTNLLAMMIYKNVEPTDFDNLKKEKGFVYTALINTEKLITTRVDEIETKINKELKPKIENIKKEQLESVKELRSLYVLKFQEILELEGNDIFKNIYIGSKQYTIEELIEKGGFDEFAKQSNISINYFQSRYGGVTSKMSDISFSNIESQVGSERDYRQRLAIIEDKTNGKEDQYRKELEKLQAEKQKLKSKSLNEIVTDSYLTTCISDSHAVINNLNLIKFLLNNGYINEKYYQYISFFYEGDISKSDNEYLLSFTNRNILPFDYKLANIDSFIDDIESADYNQSQILNFDLLTHLTNIYNKEKLYQFIEFLSEGRSQYIIDFIDQFISKSTTKINELFLTALFEKWDTFWDYLMDEKYDYYSDEERIKFLKHIFQYVEVKGILNLDKSHLLTNFLFEKEILKALNIKEIDSKKIIQIISINGNEFYDLDPNINEEILKFVYENNHYELNPTMVYLMFCKFNTNQILLNDLDTQNYTCIQNSNTQHLKDYIKEHIDDYIECVFLKLENNCHESEKTIIELLNNDDIKDKGLKLKIIDKTKTLISDISLIKDEASQLHIIQNDKIVVSWENLLHYYKDINDFSIAIVDYIDDNYNVLKLKRIDTKFDKTEKDNTVNKFVKELINSDIAINSFKEIVLGDCLPYFYNNAKLNFENLSKEKMAIFIQKKNIFKFTKENYNFINEKFNDLLFPFIEINADLLIKDLDKYDLDIETIYKLLISKLLTDIQKLVVYKTIGWKEYEEDKDICIAVAKLLFENQKTKLDNIGILKSILKTINNIEHKVVLFNLYASEIPNIELKEYIELLGEPYSLILKGKQPNFPNNTYNKEFIKKNVGNFISKTKEENEKFITITTKRKKL